MPERVLVAVDDSESARRVVRAAQRLASAGETGVVSFHAFHVPDELRRLSEQVAAGHEYVDYLRRALETKGQALVSQLAKDLQDVATSVEALVAEGKPGPAIVSACDELECDLVMVGRQGRTTLSPLLFGGVSAYVVHHARCPVIVVP